MSRVIKFAYLIVTSHLIKLSARVFDKKHKKLIASTMSISHIFHTHHTRTHTQQQLKGDKMLIFTLSEGCVSDKSPSRTDVEGGKRG